MAIIISGKLTQQKVLDDIAQQIKDNNYTPKLAVVYVGDDKASSVYVNNKRKACDKVGIKSEIIEMPECTTEEQLLQEIDRLNNDDEVNGILVQLPLPKHIDESKVIFAIDYKKDVDCFHPINTGALFSGIGEVIPCTPGGIMRMLDEYNIDVEGKNAVVIGRSEIVGKPMAHLLLEKNATITICHSRTKDLKAMTKQADILIVAIGKANFIDETYVKSGVVVIDVGINRDENNKLTGDVDFDAVSQVANAITPVPGGVGPMTIATLLQNCLNLYKKQNNIK